MLATLRFEIAAPPPAIDVGGQDLTSGSTTWTAQPDLGETTFSDGNPRRELDYMHARYSSPLTGRFLSTDPSGVSQDPRQPQSWNRYAYSLGNPLNRVDRNGRWSTKIHNEIIDRAFPGLSVSQRQILQRASARMDNPLRGGQNASRSYQHAMRSSGQTVEQASQLASSFYAGKIAEASALQAQAASGGAKGLDPAALSALGGAIHLATDAVSPAHAGFQVWAPLSHPLESTIVHPAGEEIINGTEMAAGVAAAQGAFGAAFGPEALGGATKAPKPCDSGSEKGGTPCGDKSNENR